MKWVEEKLNKIDDKLERIDTKLDAHLERITTTERDVHWLSGHLKITTGFVLSIITGLVTWWLTSH